MKFFKVNKKIATLFLLIISIIIILGISLKGNLGNPNVEDLALLNWKENGPFELSPERGRFALLYSFVEDNSLTFSIPLARFAAPDIAVLESGEYVSLFMPGVSFLTIPGYLMGKYFGASQLGAFAVIALFALLNFLLIRAIIKRLGASSLVADLAALTFIFATPAFTYAVSFYQHHISVFIMLLAIYLLLRYRNFWSLATVFFLCAASVVIDNPNLFMMFPIGVYALMRIVSLTKGEKKLSLEIKPFLLLAFGAMIIPACFFLWFNWASYGDALQLPGTLQSVEAVDENGNISSLSDADVLAGNAAGNPDEEKTAVGFFKTRDIITGLYVHLFSPDRGIIWFSPVILLGIYGIGILYRNKSSVGNLFTAIIVVNLLLYSMWGDPWGGWAFGSRYLIPTYSILAIGIGLAINSFDSKKSHYLFLAIFLILFIYSAGVNTLGALTGNSNPPKVQVLSLEELSGVEQKYTFERNWQYLQEEGSKSFVFRSWGHNWLNAKQYYFLVYFLILVIATTGFYRVVMIDKSNKT